MLQRLLEGVDSPATLAPRLSELKEELAHQTDLAVRLRGNDGSIWF
ncbi:MAG TPA: two-component sensor histidine kinase, partial [Pseudomonas sp.]|nr:two-component sensor histidine kinase [Pseudomonas sp.]